MYSEQGKASGYCLVFSFEHLLILSSLQLFCSSITRHKRKLFQTLFFFSPPLIITPSALFWFLSNSLTHIEIMYGWEKSLGENRYRQERRKPSFSSSLLDEIYRSIDDCGSDLQDLKFYPHTMQKKQSKVTTKSSRIPRKQEEVSGKRRACLVEKWVEEKANEKSIVARQRGQLLKIFERENHYDHDHDHDALLFSSTSISSDSSSGGFSSSDTDSIYGTRSRGGTKPIRNSVLPRSQKTECTLFYQRREFQLLDDHDPKQEDGFIKSKSRAMKIYSNLKKVKQPISPGGRLASFINSLFSAGRSAKSSSPSTMMSCDVDRTIHSRQSKSGQISTCSSASSFSRSCLSKNSPSTREKLRNGVKRSVRFYPVSIIVDEDCRPCGHKSLYKEENDAGVMSLSVPTSWKIGKSPSRKEEELKLMVMEKSRKVEEMARELLRDYHHHHHCHHHHRHHHHHHHHHSKKNSLTISSNVGDNYDDDDAASDSSSDLFELDHLSVIGNNRYDEELPVYETTHMDTNRAIASGLIL